MDGYKFVLDVSHHQTFNYDEVKKHIDGVIIRFGFGTLADRMADKHYDGFKEIPCAGYQWFRPDQDVKAQIELIKVKTSGKDVEVFFSDNEQQGPYQSSGGYSPTYLSEAARAHVEGLSLHGFDMGIYTRATWVDSYARPMWNWMFKYHNWLASWPFASGAVTTSWETLKSYWSPKIFSPYFTSDWPTDKRKADVWQWSGDKFIVPGIFTSTGKPRSSDFNFVSNELFERFEESTPTPTPDPLPLPVDTESRLRVLEEKVSIAQTDIDRIENVMRGHGLPI